MIRAGILGANGYTGTELVRLISNHEEVEISVITSRKYEGCLLSDVYPSFTGSVEKRFSCLDIDQVCSTSDVVFTAFPHGVSCKVIPKLYERGIRIIDLSGDFRYKNKENYEKWYGMEHEAPELLQESVYGLCEIYRDKIKGARLVANPGCYTTCSILALLPLVKNKLIDLKSIIVDAKSGMSGAGRSEKIQFGFCETDENLCAYNVANHRHTSEIEQELSIAAGKDIELSFTPHLVPMKRGIFVTCYADLASSLSQEKVINIYRDFYEGERFIRVYEGGKLPAVHNVFYSNYVDITAVIDERLNRVIVLASLDNLMKGASSQAVQNMNIMFGFEESKGISHISPYL